MKSGILITLLLSLLAAVPVGAQELKHPKLGTNITTTDGSLKIELADRRQNYSRQESATFDQTIASPKSVNVTPQGDKYYVNSLEGGTTSVYDGRTNELLKVITHNFNSSDAQLWAPDPGLYEFRHYTKNLRTFRGKPVEAAFSHNGRYLWVPYYRRSYDLNAQDPSAIAIIDTKTDEIVRLMDTGILPKMIVCSPDNTTMAVIHWGDNTVGLIDIASPNPQDWKYRACVVVGKRFVPDFSLTESVDRDTNSGYCLRGASFTPDSRWLLVGAMGGGGGIALIDPKTATYKGMQYGMMANCRHLVIANGYVYITINKSGYVQRVPLADFIAAFTDKTKKVKWDSVKVGAGARSMVITEDGKYAFVACNFTSTVCIVDAVNMRKIGEMDADSFPVGIDLSKDERTLYVTMQGRKGIVGSGNCVDIFRITYR